MKINLLFLIGGICMGLSFYVTKTTVDYPSYVPAPVYPIEQLDSAQILLGRVLFYDPILSRDGTISCASCHSPYNAFARGNLFLTKLLT